MGVMRACWSVAAWLPMLMVVGQEPEQDPARIIGKTVERQLLLEVESRLQSKDLATIAWGAWLAAHHRVGSAVPSLRKALRDLPLGEHRRFAAQSLLDALVVHGEKVPADEFVSFHRGMNEGVAMALAALDPASNREFFFTGFQRTDRVGRLSRWLACGNLLASIKDREFARLLVGSLQYRLVVTAHDISSMGGGISGGFGGRFMDGSLTVPLGFPPVVTYRIVYSPRAGDVLMAPGTKPVYYRRTVHHERKVGTGGAETVRQKRQGQRVDWIGQMLGQPWLELPSVEREWLFWKGNETFAVEVKAKQKAMADKHNRLIEQAIERKWFDDSERAKLLAEIPVTVHDKRKQQSQPLPEFAPR